MKKIPISILIIVLLALVVFASGCTSQDNQTNQSNVGNYSVNGLTFNYPVDWVITSQTRGSINNINIFDQDFLQSNGTKGDLVSIASQPKTSNVTYDTVKKSITNSTNITYNTTNGTVNIAGLSGNLTTYTGTDSNGNQTQIKLIYFDKSNFTYILTYVVGGGVNIQDQQKYFDVIINSFKVP
jgi:thioredoxin-related protein